MSERPGTAHAATGRRARHPALRLSALALLAAVWAGAPGAVRADEIVLQSGEAIEGTIVDATRNTVVIRRAIGGMRQMRIQDIEEVRIDLVQGDRISGEIMSWVDGVHQVRSGAEVVRIREGRILSRAPHEEASRPSPPAAAPQRQTEPTAAPPAVSEAERPAAEPPAAESPAAERLPPESPPTESPAAESPSTESPAAGRPAAEEPAAESPAAAGPAAPNARNGTEAVAITASVDVAEAGAAGVVFRIELSRPAERTVVLIYGTVDGTAKAGEDYEPRQGVLTLAPGTRSADVRVPLIEHRRLEGDTRFELFLTADPKVATIVDQRVTATIPGDG